MLLNIWQLRTRRVALTINCIFLGALLLLYRELKTPLIVMNSCAWYCREQLCAILGVHACDMIVSASANLFCHTQLDYV